MGRSRSRLLTLLAFCVITFAQDDLPVFKSHATSTLVWGEDSSPGANSSSIIDPVTGNPIYRISYGAIEVSSRLGYEPIGSGKVGELLSVTTTVVNNTRSAVSVRLGGARLDGHAATPLSVVPSIKGLSKQERKDSWELSKIQCISNGFVPGENFFSPRSPSQALEVSAGKALTVSLVSKDPRSYAMHCSTAGCVPKGTMRFSIIVNATNFVFVWPARSAVYCGK